MFRKKKIATLLIVSVLVAPFITIPAQKADANPLIGAAVRFTPWIARQVFKGFMIEGGKRIAKVVWEWWNCRECGGDSWNSRCVHCGSNNTQLMQSMTPPPRLGVYLNSNIVTNIEPGSAAARMRILPDDKIVAINGHPVSTQNDVARLVGDAMAAGGRIRVGILRPQRDPWGRFVLDPFGMVVVNRISLGGNL